ncbi:unnamed protein product [Closterium sp. Yama58-4]|nr:unnamed protein product [Closterium sp. Yama58-4]
MAAADPAPALVALDNAIAQIDLLISRLTASSAPSADVPVAAQPKAAVAGSNGEKQSSEKGKAKSAKPAQSSAAPASAGESVENFDKCDMRVARVQAVELHPVAEKLYVCQVEVAPGELRQVVAGLRKFISQEELQGRLVCAVCNLKPAKLAGQPSQAMMLAGSHPFAEAEAGEVVKLIDPPQDATVGDRVCIQGRPASAAPVKQLSSKVWEKVAGLLRVQGGAATFDGQALVTGAGGGITVQGLVDGKRYQAVGERYSGYGRESGGRGGGEGEREYVGRRGRGIEERWGGKGESGGERRERWGDGRREGGGYQGERGKVYGVSEGGDYERRGRGGYEGAETAEYGRGERGGYGGRGRGSYGESEKGGFRGSDRGFYGRRERGEYAGRERSDFGRGNRDDFGRGNRDDYGGRERSEYGGREMGGLEERGGVEYRGRETDDNGVRGRGRGDYGGRGRGEYGSTGRGDYSRRGRGGYGGRGRSDNGRRGDTQSDFHRRPREEERGWGRERLEGQHQEMMSDVEANGVLEGHLSMDRHSQTDGHSAKEGHLPTEGVIRLMNVDVPLHADPGKDDVAVSEGLVRAAASALHVRAEHLPPSALTVVRKSFDARKVRKGFRAVPGSKRVLVWPLLRCTLGSVVLHVWAEHLPPSALTVLRKSFDARKVCWAWLYALQAGLLAALVLAEAGEEVIVVERGQPVEERGRDIGALAVRHVLNPDSNFCYGEGGAGTWSDGKLTTRIGKNSQDVREVLNVLVRMGAPERILVDGRPHLGTDRLVRILQQFRAYLLGLGVEIRFGTVVEDLEVRNGRVAGVRVRPAGSAVGSGAEGRSVIAADRVLLGVGHSARAVFDMLLSHNVLLSPKDFAVGFRIEHPQREINAIRYRRWQGSMDVEAAVARGKGPIPVADYSLAGQFSLPGSITSGSSSGSSDSSDSSGQQERSCYSFCMCPGGQVVCTSVTADELCLNGMSFSNRSSLWANAALVSSVSASAGDFDDFTREHGALAGMEYQVR